MRKKDADMPLTDVAGLMAERQQYETWLAALDARRETTPVHVFERVRADYEGRLQRVLEKLSTHREALEERLATLERRVSTLDADERTRRDERAELELRAHVGELTAEAYDRAVADCDREIEDAVAQCASVRDEIRRTREFLDAASRPATPAVPATPVSSATPATPVAESAVSSTAPTPASGTPAVPEPVQKPDRADAAAPRTRSGGFDELAFLHAVVGEQQREVSAPPPAPPKSAAPVAPLSVAPQAPPARPAPDGEAPESDEAPATKGPPRRQSKPEWISDHSFEPLATNPDMEIIHDEPEMPLAANVTANNPIVLRPSGPVDHPKTLKCSECGAMNYATEWYCERCGAELASL